MSLYLGSIHDFGRQRNAARRGAKGIFERSKSALDTTPLRRNSTRFIYADGEWRMAPDSNEINSTLTHRHRTFEQTEWSQNRRASSERAREGGEGVFWDVKFRNTAEGIPIMHYVRPQQQQRSPSSFAQFGRRHLKNSVEEKPFWIRKIMHFEGQFPRPLCQRLA